MTETYRSTKTLSLIAIAGLAFVAFFRAGMALVGVGQVVNPELVIDLPEDGPMSAWYLIYGLLAFLQLPVFVATVVAFLIWLNRSHKNLLALRPSSLRFSSGWAVGWWFVPFANLVKPFQVVREIWWESDPDIPEGQLFLTESLHDAPTYMVLWWGFWIAANIVTNGVDRMFNPERMDDVALIGIGFIVSSVLTIIAAALAINVVRDITSRQAARFKVVQGLQHDAFGYEPPSGTEPGNA